MRGQGLLLAPCSLDVEGSLLCSLHIIYTKQNLQTYYRLLQLFYDQICHGHPILRMLTTEPYFFSRFCWMPSRVKNLNNCREFSESERTIEM